VQLAVAAFVIAMFSMFSFELAHTKSLTSQECNTACLGHSQAESILTNVNKLKKTDNEPRPPAYPQYDTNLAVFVLATGMTLAVLGWVNWYSRRMLISTQLRY
jgi:hypothetical protein